MTLPVGSRSAGRKALPSHLYALAVNLFADPAFRQERPDEWPKHLRLTGTDRTILLGGALFFVNRDGELWPKRRTWARVVGLLDEKATASEIATAEKAVCRATVKAVGLGLLEREAHGRPRTAGAVQTSNTYRWASHLVPADLSPGHICPGEQGGTHVSRRTGRDTYVPVGTEGLEQEGLTGSTPNLDGASAGAAGRTLETIDCCAGCDARHPLRELVYGFCLSCAEGIDFGGSDSTTELDEEAA